MSASISYDSSASQNLEARTQNGIADVRILVIEVVGLGFRGCKQTRADAEGGHSSIGLGFGSPIRNMVALSNVGASRTRLAVRIVGEKQLSWTNIWYGVHRAPSTVILCSLFATGRHCASFCRKCTVCCVICAV
jgi:hypothetical protein